MTRIRRHLRQRPTDGRVLEPSSRTATQQARTNLNFTAAVVAFTVVAAVLRFINIGAQSYWYDEVATVELVHHSLGVMLRAIRHTESTPPLYYVIAWFWSRIFGTSEIALRSLSAIIGTAVVPVGYLAARQLVREKAALVVAAFAAVSPILVWHSQEARAYALFVLLSAMSILFFAHAVQVPERRNLTSWALVSGLSLATHYFAIFLIVVEASWLLLTQRRRSVVYAVGAVAVVAAALSPLAYYQQKEDLAGWIAGLSYRFRVVAVIDQFVGGRAITPRGGGGYGVPGAIMVVVACGALAAVLWVLLRWSNRRDRFGGLLCLGLGAATIALPLALALIGTDFFLYRNVIAAWLPLAIAVATALVSRRLAPWGYFAAAAYVAACVVFLITINNRSTLQRDDWRDVAKALGHANHPRAVITDSISQESALAYYKPTLRRLDPRGAAVREIVTVLRGPLPTDFRPPRGFALSASRTLQHFTLTRFLSDTPRAISPQELRDDLQRATPVGIGVESGKRP